MKPIKNVVAITKINTQQDVVIHVAHQAAKPHWNDDGRPVHYGGGVIYTDKKTSSWRIYPRKGDYLDVKIKIKADNMEELWARALKLVDDRVATAGE
jgi:hypothetical protein